MFLAEDLGTEVLFPPGTSHPELAHLVAKRFVGLRRMPHSR